MLFVQFPENVNGYNRYAYVMNNPLRFTDPSGYMTAEGFCQIVGDLWNRPKGGYWKRGMSSPHYFHGSEDMDYASDLISRGGGYWRQSTSISGGFRRLPATVTGRANGKSGRVVHPIVWTPLNSSPGEWFFISTWSVHNNEMNDFWIGADDGVFMGDGRIGRGDGSGGGNKNVMENRRIINRFLKNYMKDDQGWQILKWWLEGSGTDRVLEDDYWGDYMKENIRLKIKIEHTLFEDYFNRRNTSGGPVSILIDPIIEDGYQTGYELLHESYFLTINGEVTITEDLAIYKYTATWYDKIDPKSNIPKDNRRAKIARLFYNPADYMISITWSDTYITRTH